MSSSDPAPDGVAAIADVQAENAMDERSAPDHLGVFRSRRVSLDGVVYTSVFNPFDGRKNWLDMVTAFCEALRECEDATLILKFVHQETLSASSQLVSLLYRLYPFKCRVIGLRSYLSDENYAQLISGSHYYVNTSHGEGQCLPLMEFMSCGKPAIAPDSSAMRDYIDDEVGFVVGTRREPIHWQHDPRRLFRATQSRLDWESLCAAYVNSYQTVKENPDRYLAMSRACVSRLESHCSRPVVKEALLSFLELSRKIRAAHEPRP